MLGGFVDFRREDEIAFRKTVDFVGPDLHADLSPGEKNIGMMGLVLRDSSNLISKVQSRFEVLELELALDVMIVHDIPIVHFGGQGPYLIGG